MIAINVSEAGSLDRAVKILKRKFEQAGTPQDLRDRKFFKKRSVKRRTEILSAKYRQKFVHHD